MKKKLMATLLVLCFGLMAVPGKSHAALGSRKGYEWGRRVLRDVFSIDNSLSTATGAALGAVKGESFSSATKGGFWGTQATLVYYAVKDYYICMRYGC